MVHDLEYTLQKFWSLILLDFRLHFSDLHLDVAQIVVLGNNERGHRNFSFYSIIEKRWGRGGDSIFKRARGTFAMRQNYLKGEPFIKWKISLWNTLAHLFLRCCDHLSAFIEIVTFLLSHHRYKTIFSNFYSWNFQIFSYKVIRSSKESNRSILLSSQFKLQWWWWQCFYKTLRYWALLLILLLLNFIEPVTSSV